jgi:hypothetical protein
MAIARIGPPPATLEKADRSSASELRREVKDLGAEGLASTTAPSPASMAEVAAEWSSEAARAARARAATEERLSPTQHSVVATMRVLARQRSVAARAALEAKATGAGYTVEQLDAVLRYMKDDAQLLVHFSPDQAVPGGRLIDQFLAGSPYKNQFETHVSNGSLDPSSGGCRDGWERKNFLGLYHTAADGSAIPLTPSERPKYGSLNPTKVPAGASTQYGDSYFVMGSANRGRVTVTENDSGFAKPEWVATLEDCQHLLNGLSDEYFRQIMEVGLGRVPSYPSKNWRYIEAQFHGPLAPDLDAEALVAHTRYRGTPYEAKLREFTARHSIRLQWTDGRAVTDDSATK